MKKKRHTRNGLSKRISTIIGVDPVALRGRLHYRNLSVKTASWPQILSVLKPDEISKHRKALDQVRKDVMQEDRDTGGSTPREPKAPKSQQREISVPLALAALMRADRAMGPMTVGQYAANDVASGVADAIRFLGGIPADRRKRNT